MIQRKKQFSRYFWIFFLQFNNAHISNLSSYENCFCHADKMIVTHTQKLITIFIEAKNLILLSMYNI